MKDTDSDVVIVGGGAAGIYLALQFADAGRTVQVLEYGPAWQRSDLISSQLWARRLKWRGAPVFNSGRDRVGYNMASGSGLGGAALHHYAGWPRMRESDFELRSRYGRGLDWPLRYRDLRPFYDRVQAEVGIAGDLSLEEGAPPAAPYPLPPLPAFRQVEMLRSGFEAQGLALSPAPTAVLTQPRGDRQACLYDGWCDAGCPTGALANPHALHLTRALDAGVVFRTATAATGLQVRGGRVRAVRVRDGSGERTVSGRLFVLAASAVQNARLMLAGDGGQPFNSSGLVGRFFNCHTLATAYGLMPTATDNHFGVTAGSHLSFSEYRKERDSAPFGSFFLGCGSALKPNDLLGIANTRPELFGDRLHRWMRNDGPRLATITVECESDALEANRIELAPARDAAGLPPASLNFTLASDSRALWDYARQRAEAVLASAGAEEVWTSGMITNHPMGGTIMGDDRHASVCDPFGFSHDCPNLLVAGSGLFPSAGAVGPTFTIYALALRSASHALEHWNERAAV